MKHPIISIIASGLVVSIVLTPLANAASYPTETFLGSIDSGEGQPADDAYVDEPAGMIVAPNGDMYLTDTTNNSIERVDHSTHKIYTVAGTHQYGYREGAASQAQFASPSDIAVYGDDVIVTQLFVADTANNAIRKIENDTVSTLVTGLSSPKGLDLSGDTLFISDTGNGRILAIGRNGGSVTTLLSGLNQPTKLIFWPEARSVIFVNYGADTVQSYNIDTQQSSTLLSDQEDIGGLALDGNSLYVVASRSIGVFNELWKIRLKEPSTTEPAQLLALDSAKLISDKREVELLNLGSDIDTRNDIVDWEEYYNWDENMLYTQAVATAGVTKGPTCLNIRKRATNTWKDTWYLPIAAKKNWQNVKFFLKDQYQGDFPYFRIQLQSTAVDRPQSLTSNWTNGQEIAGFNHSDVISAPTNLRVRNLDPRQITLKWKAVTGATSYRIKLRHGNHVTYSKNIITKTHKKIPQAELKSNRAYNFHVQACSADGCSGWSDSYNFRTPAANVKEISKIVPARGTLIEAKDNGNFLATLRFRLKGHQKINKRDHLRAKIQLCSKQTDHPKTIEAKRLYVLYRGGSSMLVWRKTGKSPMTYVGEHRFEDQFGPLESALVGRPKALVFSSDGNRLFIAENNQIAEYNFSSKTLTRLAGFLMDSYTEATGIRARFSDISDMAISPDNTWLYVIDRNNHRIRKVNTTTGKTVYLTGAGSSNFAFESTEDNGYQEGMPCTDVTDTGVAGCAYFNRPTGITISPDGQRLYVADAGNNRIRAINTANGLTWLIAGSGATGFTNGTGAAATFNGPYTLDVTGDGKTLYVADKYNHAIRKIDLATAQVTTVIGTGNIGYRDGSFSSAVLAIPEYVEEDNGILYWTEAGTHTVRAANLSSGTTMTLSGNGSRGFWDGTSDTQWNNPKGFGFRGGKMYVADYYNDLLRTITL